MVKSPSQGRPEDAATSMTRLPARTPGSSFPQLDPLSGRKGRFNALDIQVQQDLGPFPQPVQRAPFGGSGSGQPMPGQALRPVRLNDPVRTSTYVRRRRASAPRRRVVFAGIYRKGSQPEYGCARAKLLGEGKWQETLGFTPT